ncbi:MAG TPA: RNA 2',3'-cyclic phosphodiesterase [Anaerolineales bacterium]|nr:RNA 2',3'-cyclic phosphodiesterase [Anaerolineales bacterium]
MSLLRTFIAVDIPSHLQQTIQEQTKVLRQTIGDSSVRWVPAHNIHLTLKFVGDISPSNVDLLAQTLKREAELIPAFEIQVGGLGSFPSLKRPRVLFIGVQAPAELEALRRGIEAGAVKLGYTADEREFSPHLTIGRVRQHISTSDLLTIRRALEATKIDSLGTVRVDSIHLYKSDLNPNGSIYTRLYSAPLHT